MRTEQELDQLMLECFETESGAQIYDETRRVLSLLNRLDISSVIEIGSEGGGTLVIWMRMFRGPFFTIDLNSYSHVQGKTSELETRWRKWLRPEQSLSCIWGDSHDLQTKAMLQDKMCRTLFGLCPEAAEYSHKRPQVDMLYIDGDHSEKGVEQDYNMYKEFVRPGGIILFHDILPYPGREEDKLGLLGVGIYKFWNRLKGPTVNMFQDRSYHLGLRPNFIEIIHDKEHQSSFGFGVIFV